MSIRIINLNNGRTIIIKNQDDMNDLDTRISNIDDDDSKFTLMPKDSEQDAYSKTAQFDTPSKSSDIINRMRYRKGGNNSPLFDINSFDDDKKNHYIKTTEYPLSYEIGSWYDPATVNSPINKLKTTDIPDDQTFMNGEDQEADDQNDFNLDQDGQEVDDQNLDNPEDENVMDDEDDNQDFQGLIRTIRGACLVYKRKTQKGTYDELWIYNVGDNLKQETIIRKAILAGTDIDPNTQMSDDGQQKAKTFTIGNVQYLNITGMVQ